jgi:hypothetical protein
MSLYDQGSSSPNEERRSLKRTCISALLVAAAAVAVLLAGCGGGDSSPQAVVEAATLKGVESGKLQISAHIRSEGKQGGDLRVGLSGPFQSGGEGSLPQLAMTAEAHGTVKGQQVDFEGGLTVLADRAFIGYNGEQYEVDPTTFGLIRSGFERASQEGGKKADDVTACQEAAAGLQLSEFVENPESESGVDVDGTSTTKVSADLSAKGAVDAVIKLVEDPACGAQIRLAGPLPLGELEKARGELASTIKKAHVEVYVGDDHIIRKVVAEMTIEPPQAADERVELEFEATLSEVNEDQKIEAPAGAKPLQDLFQQLGVNPLELLEGFSGSGGGGLSGLLEGLSGGSGGSGEADEGAEGGLLEGLGGGNQQEYVECLQEAETPTDLQKCASLLR